MKEFTRTSVLEPAGSSFRGLDLSRSFVDLSISSLAARAMRYENRHTQPDTVVIQRVSISPVG